MSSADRTRQVWAGRQAIQARRFEPARSIAVKILREDRKNIDALEIKAIAEIEQGNDQAAEQTLRAAVSVAPWVRWPYAGLAELLTRHGRLADAEEVCREALRADPQNAEAHERLGEFLTARLKAFEAAAHFREAVALAGPDPRLLTRLGNALLRAGRLDEAREPLETAAAADPNAFEAAAYLAELEERVGHLDAAMRNLDRAEQAAGSQGVSFDRQRSVLLARMGHQERALELLEAKSEISGLELLQRGRLRERAGRHAEAWSDWTIGKQKLASAANRRSPSEVVRGLANRLAKFFASPAAAALPRADRREGVPQPLFII